MAGDVESAREAIMEAAAGAEDELMEKYFEEGELSQEEIMHGLRQGIQDGTVVPVVCCSSLTRVGLAKLLDNLIDLMPSPAGSTLEGVNPKSGDAEERVCADDQPFSARVFKTLADPFVGKLSLLKVTSGTLTSGTPLYNANAEKAEKAGQHLLPARRQAEPGAEGVRGATSAPSPSWAASPPATRCATRTSP